MMTAPNIAVEWEWITPTVAADLLTRNDRNRPVIQSRVMLYARDMVAGRWKDTAEPIQIAASGRLLNGQNRLHAIITSGYAGWFLVARGLNENTMDAMDQGCKRTAGQVFAIHGEQHAYTLAAALTVRFRWDIGRYISSAQPSIAEIADLLEKYPGMRQSVKFVNSNRVAGLAGASHAFLHHLFGELDQDDADDFFLSLASGANLSPESTVLMLREALIANRDAKRKVEATELVAWTIKAWNSYRKHTAVRSLRWRSEGPKAEQFPRPT